MADSTRDRGSAGDNYDLSPGARPEAPGAMTPALGRTSADLATDQPAGHGAAVRQSNPDLLAGAADVTGGLGGTKIDPDTGGDIRRGRPRDLHPEIDPDTRLGLQPTVSPEDLPSPPAADPVDARARALTGAVAGTIASAVVAALLYALYWAGQTGALASAASGRVLFGSGTIVGHLLGLLGFLAIGAAWGALFGLLVARPNLLKGVAFGLLPTLFAWLVLSPLAGNGLFNGGTAPGIGLPLLLHALIWGGLVGHLCDRWLHPPYAAATPPTDTP